MIQRVKWIPMDEHLPEMLWGQLYVLKLKGCIDLIDAIGHGRYLTYRGQIICLDDFSHWSNIYTEELIDPVDFEPQESQIACRMFRP